LRSGDFLENSDTSVDSLVQPTQIPHLWVLTSGPWDANSADLLYSSSLEPLLEKLAQRFDLIFVDTPPMSLYPEARVLGRMSNGVVMVVRANTRSREELRAAYQTLTEDGSPVLGTILNDWRVGRTQARAYSRYYSHYQQGNGNSA
jgi:Mrp family chromosome partitioning ATPase